MNNKYVTIIGIVAVIGFSLSVVAILGILYDENIETSKIEELLLSELTMLSIDNVYATGDCAGIITIAKKEYQFSMKNSLRFFIYIKTRLFFIN